MLSMEERQAVADLAAAMLTTGQLAAARAEPVRVTVPARTGDPLPAANAVGASLGYPPLVAAAADGAAGTAGAGDADPFQAIVDRQLALAELAGPLAGLRPASWPEVRAQARRTAAADFAGWCERVTVTSADGARLPVYAAGDPALPPVLLSAPCGMPARLAEAWLRHLAPRARVVTWESRALFAGPGGAAGVADQVADAIAVAEALGLSSMHVAGLCGGAVVAAELAAARPDQVRSVSLWHGDFDLGGDAPKTAHQRNLLGLMEMAAKSAAAAVSIHRVICQSLLGTVPEDLAPQLLYPYATPELLYDYCRLNSAIMRHDLRPTLPAVKQPALVVTSETDSTAHPGGSAEVTRRLPDAELVVRGHGDHISLFRAEPELVSLLDRFLDQEHGAGQDRPATQKSGDQRC